VTSQGRPLRPTDSSAVLDDVLVTMHKSIEEAGAEVVSGPLPSVDADSSQMAQLFQNLVGNALKFRAERPPRIRIDARRCNDEWLFSVEDNGIGMDMQYAERVFQMFQRLHERGKYQGSGIGLTIARRIVERHCGRIWVESEPGNGSIFYFTWPAAGTAVEPEVPVRDRLMA
jgi:light-regulated signal transduction histidine kinase (bacteriophytochrome)